jgi:hypothetical protein
MGRSKSEKYKQAGYMSIKDSDILTILQSKPGLKADDIALILKTDKSVVNGILFRMSRESKCSRDRAYRWYVSKTTGIINQTTPDEKKPAVNTPLSRLCNYYLACISYDDDAGIKVFASSQYKLDYTEIGTVTDIDFSQLMQSADVNTLIRSYKREKLSKILYLGYPTYLEKATTARWSGFFVEPIFYYPVNLVNEELQFTPESTTPIINYKAIRNLMHMDNVEVQNEIILMAEELNMNSEEIPAIDDLALALHNIRPEWPWKEDIDPYKLSLDDKLTDLAEPGIYNRCILLLTDRSPYTVGLEDELRTLSSIPESQYKNTALGKWLKEDTSTVVGKLSTDLLELLPMNSEQKEAIESALTRSLTVITGPPGTGKSQVVTNLLVNAFYNNKKVLFASKNNQAVDVVETRVNDLGPIPVLVRVGSNELRNKLRDYLRNYLSVTSKAEDKVACEVTKQIRIEQLKKIRLLEKEETEFVDLRNKVDMAERAVEKYREMLFPQQFGQLRELNIGRIETAVKTINEAVNQSNKHKNPFFKRLFWSFTEKSTYEKANNKVKPLSSVFVPTLLEYPAKDIGAQSISEWETFIQRVNTKVEAYREILAYLMLLNQLKNHSSLSDIQQKKNSILNELAEKDKAFWHLWLKIQPSGLNRDDRSTLSQLGTTLDMLINAGPNTANMGTIIRKYNELLNKLSHVFPCWSVTSLSAKNKIPFEAGFYDLLVIDEASQCDIASAVPLLYRAKSVVIIGDDKQLRHISGLPGKQDTKLFIQHKLLDKYLNWAYSYKSLFDLAISLTDTGDAIKLLDHHRSHADIINISNRLFYQDRLRVATNYSTLNFGNLADKGIKWIDVKGNVTRPSQGSAINEIEAKEVIRQLKNILFTQKYQGTVGVVTPFRAHANYIKKLINNEKELDAFVTRNNIYVDVVHKYQGDERDVMISRLSCPTT